jgi:chromosome segregation ATPase
MTNDELERIMNFIIERQERTAAQLAANAEQLAQSEALINALVQRHLEMGEKLDDHDERVARFERSYTVISNLLQKHDTQLVALTDGHNNLAELQERTIEQQSVNAEQLAQAEALINALAKRQLEVDERLDDNDERAARFERSYTNISALLEKHDTQIVDMTEGINNLVTTVNRYITTHGNGGSSEA